MTQPRVVRTYRQHSHEEHQCTCWLGDGSTRTDTQSAAARLAEVGPPCVVPGCCPIGLAPHGVVGSVDHAIPVVVANHDDAGHSQTGNANLVPVHATAG